MWRATFPLIKLLNTISNPGKYSSTKAYILFLQIFNKQETSNLVLERFLIFAYFPSGKLCYNDHLLLV